MLATLMPKCCSWVMYNVQEERARKYTAEVQSLQFNVLVTTYEYIMRDRTRLAKVGRSGNKLDCENKLALHLCTVQSGRSASLMPCQRAAPREGHM